MKKRKAPLRLQTPPQRERIKIRSWKSLGIWLEQNKWSILVLFIAAVLFVTAYFFIHDERHTLYQATSTTEDAISYDEAEIVSISRDTLTVDKYTLDKLTLGSQWMTARIKSGKFAGHTVSTTNYVSAFNSQEMSVGDEIVLCVYTEMHEKGSLRVRSDEDGLLYAEVEGASLPAYEADDGSIAVFTNASVYAPNRLLPVLILIVIFFVITTLVGGKAGIKSLLGLAFTVICLIWIMCPALMMGAPMIPTAFAICVYVAIVSFVILGGVRKKTVCAIVGTVSGMALAAIFGELAQRIARINSYNMYDVDPLIEEFKNMQLQGIPLHITGVISAGIIIASLGAVMDVAMSLSSAVSELKAVNPSLRFKELWRSGMNIGRDMVGTMTNTLILAFVGGDLVLLIWLWSLDLSLQQLMSSAFLSVELVSALASSIGVILAVPLTALVAAAIYGKPQAKKLTE